MIAKGPNGGDSHRARKSRVREVHDVTVKEVLNVEAMEDTPFIQFGQAERGHPLGKGEHLPVRFRRRSSTSIRGKDEHAFEANFGKAGYLGQLVKWAIELSEYDISYLPRTTIKAQALADFVSEMMGTPMEDASKVEKWLLHVMDLPQLKAVVKA
ncbi:UNVERIFIED_CONTAM: hypothetical protein Scaly_0534800 [Sesamum calycinum]|uniref:Uncharacterized protein n=1 Tax=Sesamum calycinum TaxID=2727403 RepID=A0AAW2RQE6_9LAMI